MSFVTLNGATFHYRYSGGDGVPIIFLNSLGTDFRIWDDVIGHLAKGVPVLCMDKRGHGLSDDAPIAMDALVQDVAAFYGSPWSEIRSDLWGVRRWHDRPRA